jgi:hypothetical protein
VVVASAWRMFCTLVSSASSASSGVPRSASSVWPTSSRSAALVSSMRPASSHATSTSLIADSRLKMNCCDCSSCAFFSSSAISSCTSCE